MVITLVNGNLGAGIAVMGVFNLVRFRSIPGSAKDIGSVFLAMAIGLATGMGFLGLAVVFTVVVAVVNLMFVLTPFGKPARAGQDAAHHHSGRFGIRRCLRRSARPLRGSESELTEVTTTNMGSLFQLTYQLRLRERGLEKAMLDELRCLNGNLKISLGMTPQGRETL